MSTRSSLWLGESEGKSVHIYWELAEREVGEGIKPMRAPIYIAAEDERTGEEVAVRLPKELATKLKSILAPTSFGEGAQPI